MIDSFNPPTIWQPFGAFSMGVIQGSGQVVHLKGQVPLDRDGNVVGKDDMRAQVRKTLENIRDVLAFVGGATADLVALTQHTTDIERFMQTGDIRREFFTAPFPATTTVEVRRLYHPDLLIEITGVAEISRDRFRHP